jgi:acyl-CoA thioesterase
MQVRDDMINGHKICHGGFLFTLADTAFAYACNGYNQFTVAQHCSINFVSSASIGERLRATATERLREGRTGIYDVTVKNQDGKIIAEFRGTSRTIKGRFLPANTNLAGDTP